MIKVENDYETVTYEETFHLTFFQIMNNQPHFFSKFHPIYIKEIKDLKPLSG